MNLDIVNSNHVSITSISISPDLLQSLQGCKDQDMFIKYSIDNTKFTIYISGYNESDILHKTSIIIEDSLVIIKNRINKEYEKFNN